MAPFDYTVECVLLRIFMIFDLTIKELPNTQYGLDIVNHMVKMHVTKTEKRVMKITLGPTAVTFRWKVMRKSGILTKAAIQNIKNKGFVMRHCYLGPPFQEHCCPVQLNCMIAGGGGGMIAVSSTVCCTTWYGSTCQQRSSK